MRITFAESLCAGSDSPSLLVRFPNWVGDAVLALPALLAIRRSLPGGRIAVLAKPWVADVVSLSGSADGVIPYAREHGGAGGKFALARALRRERFSGAVLLQNAFEAALLAWGARIPLRGGYATDGRRLLLTHPVALPRLRPGQRGPDGQAGSFAGGHQVGYYLSLVRALGFAAAADPVPRVSPPRWNPPSPVRRWVALAPGAAFGPAKMWPAACFAELGRRLASRGFAVAVLGSSAEAGTCRAVAAGVGAEALDLCGKTTLAEAASVLAGSALAVTNDSGLMHVAAATGVPLVALFGSTDPEATGPVSPAALVARGNAPCAPCFLRECPAGLECLRDITVDLAEERCMAALALGESRR